ncbi:lipopolysaccharide core biosynthesis protein rfaS [Chryseobacterium sp.]|uniref:lipopolysaccharide core biosynthesis protein rfaS n=1 Tax=Chryseobacterium sp. TaxID=1871047 RepID=UPI0025BED293|nr:lipopolysaccharide core biosynthesis protein rfaS [Chryseobacterium sp.]MBV8328188.1 lipopolysaccharide core biosynthesis protein rfaS [Chryseobacterium sp.]
MKKKILFIAPDYYGFNEVIFNGIKKHTDFDVSMAISATNERYRYRNFYERLENFFSKTFLRKNLKNIKKREHLIRQMNQSDFYDYILVNRPDILDQEMYDIVQKKGGKKIVVFWDSFSKIDGQKETIPYYDLAFSFDADDCKNYNLKKISNFYFNEELYSPNPVHEIVFLGTFDKRFDDLTQIINQMNKEHIDIKSFIYHPRDFSVDPQIENNIIKIPNIIPFNESYKVNEKGKILLDLAHENQSGLSFRPFDALGSEKKLITTNKAIKNYDFYNPNNIFVIENINNIQIPSEFFTSPYEKVEKNIREKYSFKNWINTILDL